MLAPLFPLTAGAEGLKEKDASEERAAAACGAGGIFNTMPEKKEFVSSSLQSKSVL